MNKEPKMPLRPMGAFLRPAANDVVILPTILFRDQNGDYWAAEYSSFFFDMKKCPKDDALKHLFPRPRTLTEASFLLGELQPDSCPEWKEGVGDCEKDTCMFCRTKKCIEALDGR